MGSIGARKTYQIVLNLEYILAVELLCAAQAFDYRKPLRSSKILEACHNLVRNEIDHAEEDRIFANDIIIARDIIISKRLIELTYRIAQNGSINLKGPYYELFGIH